MFGTYEDFQRLINWDFETGRSESLLFFCNSGCNIKCDICYFNIQKFKMPDNTAEKIISECAKENVTIFVNSGEPWYWWNYTRDFLIPLLNKYGGKYGLYTNGLWGRDEKIINETIKVKPQNIIISTDYWHQKNVPIEYVNNILEAFKDEPTYIFGASIYNDEHPYDESNKWLKYDYYHIWYPLMINDKVYDKKEEKYAVTNPEHKNLIGLFNGIISYDGQMIGDINKQTLGEMFKHANVKR